MKTKTASATNLKSNNARPGDTYERTRIEVHYWNSAKDAWYGFRLGAIETVEQAREEIRKKKDYNEGLQYLVDMGRFPKTRIVRVVSRCTVIE